MIYDNKNEKEITIPKSFFETMRKSTYSQDYKSGRKNKRIEKWKFSSWIWNIKIEENDIYSKSKDKNEICIKFLCLQSNQISWKIDNQNL